MNSSLLRLASFCFLHRALPCTGALLALGTAMAQDVTVLVTFNRVDEGGAGMAGLLQAADGTLFGTGSKPNGQGIIFKLRPDGSDYQIIYTFTGSGNTGSPAVPTAALVQGGDGVLYGTTRGGGRTPLAGVLYRVNPDGSGFALLHSFAKGEGIPDNDAGAPNGGLVLASDGFIYGVASTAEGIFRGPGGTNGFIYRIATDGSNFRAIAYFDRVTPAGTGDDPNSLIQGRDGRLYGTTLRGGLRAPGSGLSGTVFSVNTDGTDFRLLRSFGYTDSAPDAYSPSTPLVHAEDGMIYGTGKGGSKTRRLEGGALFRMRTDGTAYEIVHEFGTVGQSIGPTGTLIQGRSGEIYGRTLFQASGRQGVIFKVDTDGTGYRELYQVEGPNNSTALIQGQDGLLYASSATPRGQGILIRLSEPVGPTLSVQPASQAVAPGGRAVFNVVAAGATSYQWHRNGAAIPGATAASLTLNNLNAANAGTYTVIVSNARASTRSSAAVLVVAAPSTVARLSNLSILTSLSGAGDSFTLGYVVGGAGTSGTKPLVIRAVGPSLTPLGVGGALANPKLETFAGATKTGENDNWGGGTPLFNAMDAVGAFRFTGPASLDAAVATSVALGDNSVKVTPVGNLSGAVIAEIYDGNPAASFSVATPRLVNVSVLKNIGTSLTAGFVIGGTGTRTLLIRAVGPTLGAAPFNVPGVVADPQLVLFNGASARIGDNDNWGGDAALTAAFNSVGAFALPAASRDAALLVTLQPGNYSVQVSGVGGTTGVAIVEVYEVP